MNIKGIYKELLFVTHSSRDKKGKRVIVRLDNTENVLYPGELNDPLLKIMGLDEDDLTEAQEFFQEELF